MLNGMKFNLYKRNFVKHRAYIKNQAFKHQKQF